MPLPIPSGQPPRITNSPYYLREQQNWSIQQERQRHNQALYSIGEWTMFVLMWHIQDFEAGHVGRCPVCFDAIDTHKERYAEVYKQAVRNFDPVCYGTTFNGGIRARIIRPAIFADTDESETFTSRGVVHPADINIESTTDFRVRSGDYAFRINGGRYQLSVPTRITLRTGYGEPYQSQAAIGYNHAKASLEDPGSVAYLIPPVDPNELRNILQHTSTTPLDFSQYEIINGPLIPPEDD